MHADQMKVYKDIAGEHGVDPTDAGAVTHFFQVTAQTLPDREQIYKRILSETTGLDPTLFVHDATEKASGDGPDQSMPNTPKLD